MIDDLRMQLKLAQINLDKAMSNLSNALGAERNKSAPLEECLANQEKARNEWSKANAEIKRIRNELKTLGVIQ
jgi:hypothetical protein